jgi:hypothetical protein
MKVKDTVTPVHSMVAYVAGGYLVLSHIHGPAVLPHPLPTETEPLCAPWANTLKELVEKVYN